MHPSVPHPGEVHVWWSREGADADPSLLDATEAARAARFRFERDRTRYVSHHAFLRRVLAGYLGLDPAAVVLQQTSLGKPALEPDAGLAFNTSRSDGLSVVAVSGGPVGVDVEQVRRLDDALVLASGLFSPAERVHLQPRFGADLDHAFLAVWTRKEAVVKAFGLGLSVPLDAFDVCGAAGLRVTSWQGRLGEDPFTVAQLEGPPGWVAAVAVTGSRLSVHDGSSLVRP